MNFYAYRSRLGDLPLNRERPFPILNNQWELVRYQDELSPFQLSHPCPDPTKEIRSKFAILVLPVERSVRGIPRLDSSSRFVGAIKRLIARSFVRDLCPPLATSRSFDRKTRPLCRSRIHKAVSIFSAVNIPATRLADWTVERQR